MVETWVATGEATARILRLLRDGEYQDETGRRCKVRGDVSRITQIIGLSDTEKTLLRNYHFMSSRLPGTRQVRRSINHLIFSGRVIYGTPTFITVTPSERHSGLAVRLFRYRRNDPAIVHSGEKFQNYIGFNYPSIYFDDAETWDSANIDLPEYDTRRAITGRDPLCALQAFWVNLCVILPNLYGYRMCPNCPNCVESDNPCMDRFGSNATPMGGSAGRADATVGAVEAQKAEGVLHMHAFIFLQAAHQFNTLDGIGEMLRKALITVEMMKTFISNVRRASYPDASLFRQEQSKIESEWPEYKKEYALCKPPQHMNKSHGLCPVDALPLNSEAWKAEGEQWKIFWNTRLQYVMSRMNHHIHPIVNQDTGERRPLHSCCKKGSSKDMYRWLSTR